MDFAYCLTGSKPVIKRYQVAATVAYPGIPLLVPASNGAGLALATTGGAAGMIGCNLDVATYVTAQQTDGSSAQRTVAVIINPDAVWRCKMSGGATENTTLALQAVTTASTDGLAVTTGTSWTSLIEYDEGVVWGFDGANAGAKRKITSTSSTAGTVTVAFDQDTVVGDNFIRAPFWPVQCATVQLTTLLYQANAIISVATGAGFRVVDAELNDQSNDGRNNSWLHMLPTDHVLAA